MVVDHLEMQDIQQLMDGQEAMAAEVLVLLVLMLFLQQYLCGWRWSNNNYFRFISNLWRRRWWWLWNYSW